MYRNSIWYPKSKGKYSRKGNVRGPEHVEEDTVHLELRNNKYKLMIITVTKSVARLYR